MSTSFTFKQFTVWHDRCAMKVGTDGVLLGAWASIDNARRILDIGTGTGLIALQLAQRTAPLNPPKGGTPNCNISSPLGGVEGAFISAIELDPAAAAQAKENVARSPWRERIEVVCCDIRDYRSNQPYDLIVSNPPYFVDAVKCPDDSRRLARHTDSLSYDLLFQCSARLLTPCGILCIIVPAEAEQSVRDAAFRNHLSPTRLLRLYTKPDKPCRRLLFAFGRQQGDEAFIDGRQQGSEPRHLVTSSPRRLNEESLCIETSEGGYTPEYIALTSPFYVKM